MIILYGKKYAKGKREFISTLFQKDGTANGFYKLDKKGIYLYDMQGNERAFIRNDGFGPVTVTRTPKNRRFYMYDLCPSDRNWLNEPESYTESREGAMTLMRKFLPYFLQKGVM